MTVRVENDLVVVEEPKKKWKGKFDLNKFAKLVTEKEGKKKQVNIAQIKEVIRETAHLVYTLGDEFRMEFLKYGLRVDEEKNKEAQKKSKKKGKK